MKSEQSNQRKDVVMIEKSSAAGTELAAIIHDGVGV